MKATGTITRVFGVLIAIAGSLSAVSAHAALSYQGKWVTTDGSAIFHDDNRGPIPYEKCEVTLQIQQDEKKLLIQAVTVDCSITDEMPFSHEIYALEFEIRGDSLLENGHKVGTITDELISLDYADESEGSYFIDVDREVSGGLRFSFAYLSSLYQAFEVKGLLGLTQR